MGMTKQAVYASAENAVVIDYSGGDVLDVKYDAIWVGGDGDIKVVTKQGDTITFTGCLGGTILPVAVTQITQTGSTATGLIGLNW